MENASLHFHFAVRSERGPVRGDNQDAAYGDGRMLALADGMGGPPAGDVAASLMIRAIARLDLDDNQQWDAIDHLRAAALDGQHAIAAHVDANPHLDGMGTTLTAVLLDRERLALVHVGDSRAYLLRDGVLYQLTRDDSLAQSLVDKGVLSPEDARNHPDRNVLLRALVGHETRLSLINVEVRAGDRLLLYSDGLFDVLTDGELTEALRAADLDDCAERLIDLALHAGTRDNVTCLVASVSASGPIDEPVFAGAYAERSD
jgi:serine/threonine protein phosphatase PrpC